MMQAVINYKSGAVESALISATKCQWLAQQDNVSWILIQGPGYGSLRARRGPAKPKRMVQS